MKRKEIALIALTILVFLSGCKNEKASQIEQDVSFFCSETCNGRLPGSLGNDAARDYIADAFDTAGLLFLQGFDSYLLPYTQSVFDMEQQKQTLTATFSDGTQKTYTGGKDFYPYLNLDDGFSGKVTTDPDDPDLREKVFLAGTATATHGKATIFRSDMGIARITDFREPQFTLNTALFDQLKDCTYLSLEGAPVVEEETVCNVAGVLEGRDRTGAWIIGAHFDHLGKYGNTLYPGAFDNASGVSVMLETLRQCVASNEKPAYDIIFVAFNGEEMGFRGSNAFAKLELPYQRMNLINLDCVGLKQTSQITVTSDGKAENLVQQIVEYMQTCSTDCVASVEPYASDQISFLSQEIPAVGLYSNRPIEELNLVANTPADVPETLDFDFLSQLAENLRSYLFHTQILVSWTPIETAGQDNGDIPLNGDAALWEAAYRRGQDLIDTMHPDFSEEIPFEVQSRFFTVRDSSWTASVSAAREAFPEAYFPAQLGTFVLSEDMPLVLVTSQQPQTSHAIQVYQILPSNQVILEQPRPIETQFNPAQYMLHYYDPNGVELILMVYDRQSVFASPDNTDQQEVLPLEDGSKLYPEFAMIEGEKVISRVWYDNPMLPCLFQLCKRVNTAEPSNLSEMLVAAAEELSKMIPLP